MCSWPFLAPLSPSPPIAVKPTAERDASATNRCTSWCANQQKGSVYTELMMLDTAAKVCQKTNSVTFCDVCTHVWSATAFVPLTAWWILSPRTNGPGDLVGLDVYPEPVMFWFQPALGNSSRVPLQWEFNSWHYRGFLFSPQYITT